MLPRDTRRSPRQETKSVMGRELVIQYTWSNDEMTKRYLCSWLRRNINAVCEFCCQRYLDSGNMCFSLADRSRFKMEIVIPEKEFT